MRVLSSPIVAPLVGDSPAPLRRGENVVASWFGVEALCSLLGVAGRVDCVPFVGVVERKDEPLLLPLPGELEVEALEF